MTVRQVIANFWVQLERETGEIPHSIALGTRSYDALVSEFGGGAKALVAKSRLQRRRADLVLMHTNGQKIIVTRAPLEGGELEDDA